MLKAAFGRWEGHGTLEPRPGDPAQERLDQWLRNIRLGLAVDPPPAWLRAVLGAMGLDWDAPGPSEPPAVASGAGAGQSSQAAEPRRSRTQADDHLLAAVNLVLQEWGKPSVEIEEVQRALDQSPPSHTDQHGMAHDIAQYLAFGEVTRVRGGGSGIEAEFTNLMTISGDRLDQLVARQTVLAYEPGQRFTVTVDNKGVLPGRRRQVLPYKSRG